MRKWKIFILDAIGALFEIGFYLAILGSMYWLISEAVE